MTGIAGEGEIEDWSLVSCASVSSYKRVLGESRKAMFPSLERTRLSCEIVHCASAGALESLFGGIRKIRIALLEKVGSKQSFRV